MLIFSLFDICIVSLRAFLALSKLLLSTGRQQLFLSIVHIKGTLKRELLVGKASLSLYIFNKRTMSIIEPCDDIKMKGFFSKSFSILLSITTFKPNNAEDHVKNVFKIFH